MNGGTQGQHAPLRWGIAGPGRIANKFAQALQHLPDASLVAVQGRRPEAAAAFAQQWRVARKDGGEVAVPASLAELVHHPEVDAVYVATPHSHHGEPVQAALLAGKAVLCEKPLVVSVAAAEPLFELSRSRGVFLMEALWTRFLPVYAQVGRWLREGRIGALRSVHSSFCFPAVFDAQNRLFNPDLAGGAVLDLGVYNLNALRFAMQQANGIAPGAALVPKSWHIQGERASTGVDLRVAGMLGFEGGLQASFECGLASASANALRIEGQGGHILLPTNFWRGVSAELHLAGATTAAEVVHAPAEQNGFEGQIEEATRCIRSGLTESAAMPHAETLAVLSWTDRIRAQLNVRYPFEEPLAQGS